MYLNKADPDELLGIAFGFPGPFDYQNGLCFIQGQSKYDHLYQVNIKDELKKLLNFNKSILFCNDAEAAMDINHGNASPIKVFHEFGEDLGQFLHPFAADFAADVLLVLGGIAGAIEYFRNKLEDRLNIPVYTGKLQGAAMLGAAQLFYY